MAHEDDIQRALGRVEGKIESLGQDLSQFKLNIKEDLTEIKVDVKLLNQFKWRVAGGAAILSCIITGIVELIHMYQGMK